MNRPQQSTTTGSSRYGPPHSISHIHYIFSTFSHSLLLQVFLIIYITQPYTIYLLPCTPHKLFIKYFPSYTSHHPPFQLLPALHIISPPFFSYFLSYTSYHLRFFSYFPPYTSHHLRFSAISRLTHYIASVFQLFPALHIITSVFQLFPALHITSPPFQQFPVLHITSPPLLSYFPSYTSHHLPF